MLVFICIVVLSVTLWVYARDLRRNHGYDTWRSVWAELRRSRREP